MSGWIALAEAGKGLLSGYFAQKDKEIEEAVHRYNAAVKRQEAEAIKKRTKFQQTRWSEQAARIQGDLEASVGGSGTVSTQGAPMLALALQKQENEIQDYLIGLQGRMEAEQALSTADEYDMLERKAETEAKQIMRASYLGAGASAMSSYSSWPKKTTPSTGYTAASTGSGGYGGTMGGGPTGGASRSMRM